MQYPFLRFPDFKYKAVTLSYDDGTVFDKRLVEIMDKYGLKGTFNLNSGMFGNTEKRRLSREEILALFKDSVHEIAIHGKNHRSLGEAPMAMATEDVLSDRVALEEMFDRIVTGMAYSFGTYNDEVVQMLQACGVEYARTIQSTEKFDIPTDWLRMPATCHHKNPRLMELAREFVALTPTSHPWNQCARLFYVWGHSYEFNDADNWHIIEEFAEFIGGREDIWYATNMEICKYVKAYDQLQFSALGDRVYNPTDTDVYMRYFGKDVLVKAGQTVKL